MNSNYSTAQYKVKEENQEVSTTDVRSENSNDRQDFTATQLGFEIYTMASMHSTPASEVKQEIQEPTSSIKKPSTSFLCPSRESSSKISDDVKAEPFDAHLLNLTEKVVDLTNDSDDLEEDDSGVQMDISDDVQHDATNKDSQELEEEDNDSGYQENAQDEGNITENRNASAEKDGPKKRMKSKKHSCDVCQKNFRAPIDLANHYRCHTGEKPFNCQVCPKKFSRQHHLARHMSVHSLERPYRCDVCGASFKLSNTLAQHNKVHTGVKSTKSFNCEICNKTFSRKDGLAVHMRTHSGERPFPCGICGKAFRSKQHLQGHLRTYSK